MMRLDGVSVVIPVFGDAPYLAEAVQSTLAQKLSVALEVVLVCTDVSTPTRQSIELLQDRRVYVVECDSPGLPAALNFGLLRASYEFVARMDADDVMLQGRLQRQYDYLKSQARVVAVGGQIRLIGDHAPTRRTVRYPTASTAVRRESWKGSQLAHPSVMFRRSVVMAIGGYREEFSAAEDYDLWLRLLDVGELANLPHEILAYRLHPHQVSRTKAKETALFTLQARFDAKDRQRGRSQGLKYCGRPRAILRHLMRTVEGWRVVLGLFRSSNTSTSAVLRLTVLLGLIVLSPTTSMRALVAWWRGDQLE